MFTKTANIEEVPINYITTHQVSCSPVASVGFPSVCCEYVLLPLVNIEAALAYSREEASQGGRDKRERR